MRPAAHFEFSACSGISRGGLSVTEGRETVSVASGSPWGIGESQDTVRQHTAFVWRGSLCTTNPTPFASEAHLHLGCAFYGAKVDFCSLPSGSRFRSQDTGNCPSFRFFPELVFLSLRGSCVDSFRIVIRLQKRWHCGARFDVAHGLNQTTRFPGASVGAGLWGGNLAWSLCEVQHLLFIFFFEGIRVPIPLYGRVQPTVSFLLAQEPSWSKK